MNNVTKITETINYNNKNVNQFYFENSPLAYLIFIWNILCSRWKIVSSESSSCPTLVEPLLCRNVITENHALVIILHELCNVQTWSNGNIGEQPPTKMVTTSRNGFALRIYFHFCILFATWYQKSKDYEISVIHSDWATVIIEKKINQIIYIVPFFSVIEYNNEWLHLF